MKTIKINCFGDSVTEGMSMVGHHTSEYGRKSYPAQLYTILKDNGYDVEVQNYGHGGECLADIAARVGAYPCVTCEDIVLPGSGEGINLGKNPDTKLRLSCGNGAYSDRKVFFTQMSHDTNPIYLDGVLCQMSAINMEENIIALARPGRDMLVPKGSMLFTANDRNADVNIFYAGINDGDTLSLEEYVAIMKKCAEVNGGKYIVLGCTHAIWEKWSDLEGSPEEKYEQYKNACYKAFGVHFIDLYDEFSRHSVDMLVKEGKFSDKSEEELQIIREKLAGHIIPAELVFDYKLEDNVHLSSEGYLVIALLVFERLKRLSYI